MKTFLGRTLILSALALGLNWSAISSVKAASFENTGAMSTARQFHTATMLPNGKVLVAGGNNNVSGTLSSAELYDPRSGTWAATGALSTPREFHTATLLLDGKVLVAGGGTTTLNYMIQPPERGRRPAG